MYPKNRKEGKNFFSIFQCLRCKRYLFAKENQKAKKCPQCGKNNKMNNVMIEEIVASRTEAMNTVKRKQNHIALLKFGSMPDFKAENMFYIRTLNDDANGKGEIDEMILESDDDYINFLKILKEIKKDYNEFPPYVLKILAKKYGISESKLKIHENRAIREGFLIKQNREKGMFLYKISF
ncbi:MAG: DUF1922 domain-containing protein [Promethearchaeota archaeon]